MSSSIAKTAASPGAAKPTESQPQTLPVLPNPSPASQAVRHAVPAALAAAFVVRFHAFVADPVAEMTRLLPAVVVLQVGYALVSLPAAGSQVAKTTRKPRPGEKNKAGEVGGTNYIIAAILSLLLTVLVSPFVHGAMLLFGAPVLTNIAPTFLCAAHLAVLSLFPIFYVRGVDGAAWVDVAGFKAPFDETFGGLVGGVLGAWLGAVPIPLDWDREWQKWPVTVLCGIYGGYVLGKVIGGTLLYGKRF